MCCMMPKKKVNIYFIFKDSTRGLIFIPEKSGFKDLTTMLKSYPLLINLSMRKKHWFMHVSFYGYNKTV
jgi:hypothetical protein